MGVMLLGIFLITTSGLLALLVWSAAAVSEEAMLRQFRRRERPEIERWKTLAYKIPTVVCYDDLWRVEGPTIFGRLRETTDCDNARRIASVPHYKHKGGSR